MYWRDVQKSDVARQLVRRELQGVFEPVYQPTIYFYLTKDARKDMQTPSTRSLQPMFDLLATIRRLKAAKPKNDVVLKRELEET